MNHLFDGTDMNVYDQKIVNLSAGAPGIDLLSKCCELFKIATEHRMKYELENNSYLFQYGPTVGMKDFTTTLSTFLTDSYEDNVNSSDLITTNGASGGLHIILSSLINMKGVIFVDEVTYMIALESISMFTEMKIVPVPMTKNGVNINEFRKLIKKNLTKDSNGKMFWGMYYTIPNFHNPTGILFSKDICQELIKLSREEDFLIVCDDVYNLLHYTEGPPPKRLFRYDNMDDKDYKGNVISNGSFSKILSPGLRIGWIECPPRLIHTLGNCGVLKSGGSVNNYTSGVLTSLIKLGLAKKQLQLYSATYKDRMKAVCDILEKNLPPTCFFQKPLGGYFVWIEFPGHIDAAKLNDFCKEHYEVVAITGSRFSVEGKFKNFIRITIGFHECKILKPAVTKFCEAIKYFLNNKI